MTRCEQNNILLTRGTEEAQLDEETTEREKPVMKLKERIELLHRSSGRLVESLNLPRDVTWWAFMRKETWIHLQRAFETWWHVFRGKE